MIDNHLIGVASEDLQIIKQILIQHVPEYSVWAFGSRVNGNPRKFSDLDLAIISSAPLNFNTYAALKEAFSESNLPFKVDVVDWANLDDNFKKIIEKNFVEIK